MLFRDRSSKISNFSDLLSKTGSEAVSAFGIGRRLADGNVCGWGANSILDVEGRSFVCSLVARCCFDLLVGCIVESLRTPVTMLRLFTGVILKLVAIVVLTGIDVLATEVFSGSESESWSLVQLRRFLLEDAINLSICFWFSAKIFVRSDKISFLKDVFISSKFPGSILRVILGPAIKSLHGIFSFTGVSKSPETSSPTVFLFWLLVVFFQIENSKSSVRLNTSKSFVFSLLKRNYIDTKRYYKLTKLYM